jgi:hypothetical protein
MYSMYNNNKKSVTLKDMDEDSDPGSEPVPDVRIRIRNFAFFHCMQCNETELLSRYLFHEGVRKSQLQNNFLKTAIG